MKILIVCEKEGTAIYRLALMTAKAAPWHEFRIVCVHPKRPTAQQYIDFNSGYEWCDLIDFRYWRTAELLKDYIDIRKPAILTHYNPYDLKRADWGFFKKNIVVNNYQNSILRTAKLVPLPVDLDYWEFQTDQEYCAPKKYDILMVANRIEGKKGIIEVVKAAKELKLKMALVGNISDPNYFEQIQQVDADIDFMENISDDDLKKIYYDSKIHVCNSIDNFESGTMPILEAMACGLPVLTRNIGHVPEIADGVNMVVRKGQSDDKDDLKNKISALIDDQEWRLKIRNAGRTSLRYRGLEIYGLTYSKIYHSLFTDQLISVVMPICGDHERWGKSLASILALNLKDFEVIVVDDSPAGQKANKHLVEEVARLSGRTVKYYDVATFDRDGNKTYGLARARNKGILEAEGKYIFFIDDRQCPEPNSANIFLNRIKPRHWLWGIKDDFKKGFVENFSFIHRADIVSFGMFSDQITQYGGMTQEVRKRAEKNGISFEMVEDAKSITSRKSSSRFSRFNDIAKSKVQCYKLHE